MISHMAEYARPNRVNYIICQSWMYPLIKLTLRNLMTTQDEDSTGRQIITSRAYKRANKVFRSVLERQQARLWDEVIPYTPGRSNVRTENHNMGVVRRRHCQTWTSRSIFSSLNFTFKKRPKCYRELKVSSRDQRQALNYVTCSWKTSGYSAKGTVLSVPQTYGPIWNTSFSFLLTLILNTKQSWKYVNYTVLSVLVRPSDITKFYHDFQF